MVAGPAPAQRPTEHVLGDGLRHVEARGLEDPLPAGVPVHLDHGGTLRSAPRRRRPRSRARSPPPPPPPPPRARARAAPPRPDPRWTRSCATPRGRVPLHRGAGTPSDDEHPEVASGMRNIRLQVHGAVSRDPLARRGAPRVVRREPARRRRRASPRAGFTTASSERPSASSASSRGLRHRRARRRHARRARAATTIRNLSCAARSGSIRFTTTAPSPRARGRSRTARRRRPCAPMPRASTNASKASEAGLPRSPSTTPSVVHVRRELRGIDDRGLAAASARGRRSRSLCQSSSGQAVTIPIRMTSFMRRLLPFPYPDRPRNTVSTPGRLDKGAPSRMFLVVPGRALPRSPRGARSATPQAGRRADAPALGASLGIVLTPRAGRARRSAPRRRAPRDRPRAARPPASGRRTRPTAR